MPKIVKALSAIEVSRLKAPGRYAVGTLAGLLLAVKDTGARSWVLRTSYGAERIEMGLGAYPEITLAVAHERARAAKAQIAQGVNPIADRRKVRNSTANTFRHCAERYIALHRDSWKSEKHAAQWKSTLETYAYPVLRALPVDQVEMAHVLAVVEKQWNTKNETMVRTRNRIELVLDWAAVQGFRSKENPARWRGNLEHVLPAPRKVNKREHHTALPYRDMHTFMEKLRAAPGLAAQALQFAILTAARSGEVRCAAWSEIDPDGGVWTIPGSRMKAGREHRIPLPAQALDLLKAQPRIAGTDLIFPGRPGRQNEPAKPLSDMTLTACLRRMKVDAVPHGFRSTFRDWAAETTLHPPEVCEMALAHVVGNDTEAAYRRGDLFEKRRQLMADWAKYIDTPPARGNVATSNREAA